MERLCAIEPEKVNSIQYYRGQNPMKFEITTAEPDEIIFQDGSDASDFVSFDRVTSVIEI